jgi:hypothetical protein
MYGTDPFSFVVGVKKFQPSHRLCGYKLERLLDAVAGLTQRPKKQIEAEYGWET